MRIESNNCEYEANAANTTIYTGETLINSVYTDLDDDYSVIPENTSQDYVNVLVRLIQEGVTAYRVESYDPNAEPFCFIINGICRAFRKELDRLQIED
jgi:hypothetical protein